MKKSIYNQYVECDQYGYIYNTLSGALIKFNKELYAQILNGDFTSDEVIAGLQQCGMLVPTDTDELQSYIELKTQYISSDNILRLTIAPTLDCNFRCSYCYEKHTQEYMSEDIQHKLLQFTEDRLKTGKYKKLSVFWYGGEPLLGIKIIENLSKNLNNLCQKYNLIYLSYMVTNGYLLEKYADTVAKCNINEVQVTIDGSKAVHNKRRVYYRKNELGTYDNIIAGIIANSKNNIYTTIRVNIDLRNQDDIANLFSEITDAIKERSLIRIYPGKLFCMPSTESKCGDFLLNQQDFVDIQLLFQKLSKKYGFREKKNALMPSFRAWYCPAPYGNAIVVAPNGHLFACWNDIGQSQFKIGDLSNTPCICNEIMNTWLDGATKLEDKCKICKSLPICGGGCLRSHIHGIGKIECDDCYSELQRILVHEMKLK